MSNSRPFSLPAICGWCLVVLAGSQLSAAPRIAMLQASPELTGAAVALAEAKLLNQGNVELVERTRIAEILREHQLQAALGAGAVAGRISLGKLLKADLLVALQLHDSKEPIVSVVICETRQGLRLLQQGFRLSRPDDDASTLVRSIDAAVESLSQASSEIFAVPPFVSHDLGFEFAHLKGAYAKVVEGALVEHKGVRAVELDEARAVSREIAISAGDGLRRPLPLYVLGEYRHEGKGEERRVRLGLKLMRGESELSSVSQEVPPARAAEFLREAAARFLKQSAAAAQPAGKPQIEAQQLSERARLHLLLGNWQESLDLVEASLLLDRNQPRTNLTALVAIRQLGEGRYRETKTRSALDDQQVAYYRRGLEHLEAYVRGSLVNAKELNGVPALEYNPRDAGFLNGKINSWQPGWQNYLDARQEGYAMIERVLDDKLKHKVIDDSALLYSGFEFQPTSDSKSLYARRLQLLKAFTYLPDEGKLLPGLSMQSARNLNEAIDGFNSEERLEFLKQARALPNEDLRRVADKMIKLVGESRIRRTQELADAKKPVAPPAPRPADADPDLTVTKLALRIEGQESSTVPRMAGWIPAGDGVDFVWGPTGMYVMKQQGLLRKIDGRDLNLGGYAGTPACYDGQFVWSATGSPLSRSNSSQLIVIDPESEQVREIGVGDGLPKCNAMAVTPLAKGRVLVVGYFTHAIAAIIEFEPHAGAKVRIIHEFRHIPKPRDVDEWRDVDLAFQPAMALTLSERGSDGIVKQRVLVGRQPPGFALSSHPILINPQDGTVQVIDEAIFGLSRNRCIEHGGIGYHLSAELRDDKELKKATYTIVRQIRISGITQRDFRVSLPNGVLFEYGGALHVLGTMMMTGNRWCVAGINEASFRDLIGNVPLALPCKSSHYGLVLIGTPELGPVRTGHEPAVYQVIFNKPVPEMTSKP